MIQRRCRMDSVCPRSKEEDKSMEHLCFECIFSKHIWRPSRLNFNFEVGQSTSVEDWMTNWFKITPDDEVVIESIKVLWGIWLHRNKAVFEQIVADPSTVVHTLNQMKWEYNKLANNSKLGSISCR
ncbi:hypothetical protein HYC85_032131 [Camellia sinensis]|uniref:Reverse transcriptase zinc-binding domain-containing protein n=1 Tax=Camellia sinensis TaxID=4442 RepID=A0A7J7FUD4_CAMSI|nr:hypothetical protein HYC85_032131 [Camellia sinensis]